MTNKASHLSPGRQAQALTRDRFESRVAEHARNVRDIAPRPVTPGFVLNSLRNSNGVLFSAIPHGDLWTGLKCELCSQGDLMFLHSVGPSLVLQKDAIGLTINRHNCPKMHQHHGRWLTDNEFTDRPR
jgi:hypothetical protein